MKQSIGLDKIIIGVIIICAVILFFYSTETWAQNIKFIILNNLILFMGGLIVVIYLLKHYGKI